MQSKTSYTTYSAGLTALILALVLFLGFIKALIVSEFIIAIVLMIPCIFLGVLVQYIFVSIIFDAEKIVIKRPFLFWNVWPSRKYKMVSTELNQISCVRFSSSAKGAFVFALIDLSGNFLYRVEASSTDYFFLKDEFEKRNIKVKDYWDGDKGLAANTQKWRERKSKNYKS